MYIEQVQKNSSKWWKYLIGLSITIIGVRIFSIPHITAISMKMLSGDLDLVKIENNDIAYLMGLFDSNLNLLYILLPFVGGILFLLFVTKVLHRQSFTNLTTSRSKIDWKRVGFAFILWGAISTSMTGLDIYFSADGDYLYNFELNRFLILAVIAICLVPLQTSFEEYMFRGYLMQGIGNATRIRKSLFYFLLTIFCLVTYRLFIYDVFINTPSLNLTLFFVYQYLIVELLNDFSISKNFIESKSYDRLYRLFRTNFTPLFITSLAFGLMHLSNPEVDKLGYVIMIYYIGTGFFLGILTLMDDGLELALGFHAANNLFIALLVTADWTAFQTYSIYRDMSDPTISGMELTDILVPVFVIFPILLLIFSKKYNWNNKVWFDQLAGPIKDIEVSKDNIWDKR